MSEHPTDVRQLLVHPALWPTLIGWLEGHGLEVNRMHGPTEDDLATYTISPCVLQAESETSGEDSARLGALEEAHRTHEYDLRHAMGYVRDIRRRVTALEDVITKLGLKLPTP
ncbi:MULTISPECIES: hypothetical protein [unclassified Nocardiopsis]|uniref:hypothetical protein n=1 Tax=Nocardiopsis TaxID=2013 RepID=UPI00387B66E8